MGEDDLCRLCAENKSADDLLNISDEYWTKQKLDVKISRFFQIKISPDDRLPKSVCSKCCEKVIITADFNDKVQQAQQTLKTVFSDEEDGDYDCVTFETLQVFDTKGETNNQDDYIVECTLSDNSQTKSSMRLTLSCLVCC